MKSTRAPANYRASLSLLSRVPPHVDLIVSPVSLNHHPSPAPMTFQSPRLPAPAAIDLSGSVTSGTLVTPRIGRSTCPRRERRHSSAGRIHPMRSSITRASAGFGARSNDAGRSLNAAESRKSRTTCASRTAHAQSPDSTARSPRELRCIRIRDASRSTSRVPSLPLSAFLNECRGIGHSPETTILSGSFDRERSFHGRRGRFSRGTAGGIEGPMIAFFKDLFALL